MKKGGGSDSKIIIGPSKSVVVYAVHSLEYGLRIRPRSCLILGVRAKIIIITELATMLRNFSKMLNV